MLKTTIPVLITIFSCLHLPAQQNPAERPGQSYLLKTNWDQYGLYTKYTPNNEVLGCWSTAMAQILYHHRLRPSGFVNYQCSKGFVITDTLEKHSLSWTDFSASLDATSPPRVIETVARYSMLTAEAVRKDFGSPRYLQMVNPAGQIEKYFPCKAIFYASFTGDIPLSPAQVEEIAKKENIQYLIGRDSVQLIIKQEINNSRPVYFHFGNFTTYGHSTVIDGYHEEGNIFWVHINYGSGGKRTGWYQLFQPIDVVDDIKLRVFVTISPLQTKTPK
jgi:hypothetical protein